MDVHNLESDISRYKSEVELATALERLENSKDFQQVISNGYLQSHLLNLVSKRHADLTPDNDISRQIDAVSNLMAFLENIKTTGATAQDSLAVSEQTLFDHYNEDTQ